ncbi:aminoglycoside 6'-N-acetyltransferase [Novosphingobium kaempferiae]|uniref:aminoglycoside 6'-N-acetyltransferase n=1 Tax=Novosphingobium kaempferiae TaxID=2896849 RepID=UPI001E39EE0B|nr:aminoglycoside 6'-N-acetyltransferase [Novosphingobium kaempferiae]
MIVRIEFAGATDLDDWAALRAALWPDGSTAEHRKDLVDLMAEHQPIVGFLARDLRGTLVGFAEAALRIDYVNGCETSPVAFLEGLFVAKECRRQGIGRGLVEAVEAWARLKGCTEMASDALMENTVSHAMHAALDFEETERVVFFRKVLDPAPRLS